MVNLFSTGNNSYLKVCLKVRDYKTKSSENKVIRQQFKKCTECKGTAKNLQVTSQERKKEKKVCIRCALCENLTPPPCCDLASVGLIIVAKQNK